MFKVGMKIVCVDDSLSKPLPPGYLWVKKNEIYTIRDLYIPPSNPLILALVLEEILSPFSKKLRREKGFKSSRFIPYDDKFATNVLEKIEKEINKEIEIYERYV